jgi:hypothetical protein
MFQIKKHKKEKKKRKQRWLVYTSREMDRVALGGLRPI